MTRLSPPFWTMRRSHDVRYDAAGAPRAVAAMNPAGLQQFVVIIRKSMS